MLHNNRGLLTKCVLGETCLNIYSSDVMTFTYCSIQINIKYKNIILQKKKNIFRK